MKIVRAFAKRIPGIRQAYISYLNYIDRQRLKDKTPETVFTEIYQENRWGNNESVSGPGSASIQTKNILQELPLLLRKLDCTSVLDIPCGDFNWLKDAKLEGIKYIGADIVDEIINKNKSNFQSDVTSFQKLNLLSDDLPTVDLIFCRDCLVHFSFQDIQRALKNICRSGSKYLLTTTFTERQKNVDILTGQWRTINLTETPFNLPKPDQIINESCSEGSGKYADKSLGLWEIDEIRRFIG